MIQQDAQPDRAGPHLGAVPPIPSQRRADAGARPVSPALLLAILSIASFLAQLDVWVTNVGLPAIGRGTHAGSLADLSWVLNGYAIVYAALLVPAGRLVDRFGRKGGFLLGLTVFAVASIGAGLSSDIWVLIGFRVLQAAGAALLTPASLGLVLLTAPPAKIGTYVKIWFTTGALSAASGPVLGGLLVEASWRWLFLVNIPVAAAAIALGARYLPSSRDAGDHLPDLRGGGLLIVAIGALALGLVKAPDWGWSSTQVVVAFVLAAVALALFLASSARHPAPVVTLALFRNRVFTTANLVATVAFMAFGIELLSTILWLQGHWHYSVIRTGLASTPGPVMFAVGSAVAETLQARTRLRAGRIAVAGALLAAAGTIMLTQLVTDEPQFLAAFLPTWVVLGLGYGLAVPTAITRATVGLPPQDSATGSAIVTMATQLGSVIGISILVAILGRASGAASHVVFQHAWYVSAGALLAAALASFGLDSRATAPSRPDLPPARASTADTNDPQAAARL